MGLMLARAAERFASPGMKLAGATLGATAATAGLVLGIQYGYGDDLSTTQTEPGGANLAVGITGAAVGGLGAAITSYQWLGSPYSRFMEVEAGRTATILGTGLAIGSLLGGFVAAPVARRAMGD